MNRKPNSSFHKQYRKQGMRMVGYLLGIVLFLMSALLAVLLVRSPGTPEPFLDEEGSILEGSISEKVFVHINGVEQGMFIRGKDKAKPVLLFLHGGPGMPENAIARQYPVVLEDDFVVCWWEQRGAGLSYNDETSADTLTFKQLIADTLAVTNHLRERFDQEKITLMAHSGGTFIGIQAAAQAPELYHAYIGMSQISYQLESEKLAYQYMVEAYRSLGDEKMLKKLGTYPLEEINTPSYYVMRDKPMHELGIGTTHKMKSVVSGVFWPTMLHREYLLGEKIRIWKGKHFNTMTCKLWSQLVEVDLTKRIRKLEIPVLFLHGIHDYTVSYPLAKAYFDDLQAPRKAFHTFDHSAHSPLFEEPEKAREIILNELQVEGMR